VNSVGNADGSANPRALLLALLQAFDCTVPVQLLLRAAALFDIDDNRTRVALHRLRSKGLIHSEERGSYRISRGAAATSEVRSWRRTLDVVVPWGGAWVAAHTAPLPRADKTIARRRDRVCRQLGLRELQPGLLIRPDNLRGGTEAVRAQLWGQGLEREAPVFRLDQLGPYGEQAASLWDDLALDASYRRHTEGLTRLTLQVRTMDPICAARDAFLAGGAAVRDIVTDPLLPAPMVDPGLREAFVETMVAFDEVARLVWSSVLDTDLHLTMAPTVEPR